MLLQPQLVKVNSKLDSITRFSKRKSAVLEDISVHSTPLQPIQQGKDTPVEERMVTLECISLTRDISISLMRLRGKLDNNNNNSSKGVYIAVHFLAFGKSWLSKGM